MSDQIDFVVLSELGDEVSRVRDVFSLDAGTPSDTGVAYRLFFLRDNRQQDEKRVTVLPGQLVLLERVEG